MSAHLVGRLEGACFASEALRIGDLNVDGAPDLLFTQSLHATREITCLTAATLTGETLWQVGEPDAANCRIYSDLPVQIHDWDGDGRNEVLYIRQAEYVRPVLSGGWAREQATEYSGQATLVVLDGATGRENMSLPLPAPADDCLLFADFTGRGWRGDLLVKDRYWNMWGISNEGKELWTWRGSTGHFPAIADIDGDGRDEVFVGFALIDHDGRVIFETDAGGAHQDAACITRTEAGDWRLLFGNHGLHALDETGRELWFHGLAEAQHVIAGCFQGGGDQQVAVIDRGQPVGNSRGPATLYLFDLNGRELWRREQPPGSWVSACIPINWRGKGLEQILVYGRGPGQPVAIYDGHGEIVDTMPYAFETQGEQGDGLDGSGYYCTRADVWGDSRDEVIFFGGRGACMYANSGVLSIPTLYNNTLYPGM